MHYGDEYGIICDRPLDLDSLTPAALGRLFRNADRLTGFESAPDHSFIQDDELECFDGQTLCYRVDCDSMIEINNSTITQPMVIRNQMADLVSFQFVSMVRRSEFLGKRRHVHDLGPALIVTAIPQKEVTYRVPETQVPIRHVAIYTTLSSILERMSESREHYPDWLAELLAGAEKKTQQRVFFLEDIYREPIWSCFHLPVAGTLVGPWMAAKFGELLCIGLQILKNSHASVERGPLNLDLPWAEKIRKARSILSLEYACPPSLPQLARMLGISETQLKTGFKSMNGTTILQYCINKRIEAARLLLKDNRHSISEIGDIVGYEDHSAFSRAFRRLNGCSPQEWRRTWSR